MCGFHCTGFIEYMIAGKTLLDYNLFPRNDFNSALGLKICAILAEIKKYKSIIKKKKAQS